MVNEPLTADCSGASQDVPEPSTLTTFNLATRGAVPSIGVAYFVATSSCEWANTAAAAIVQGVLFAGLIAE